MGCGYWGQKPWFANFHQRSEDYASSVTWIAIAWNNCNPCTKALVICGIYYEELFARKDIEGIVIAAPAVQHYPLAKQALEMGKDIFVEKPLSLHVEHAEELTQLAQKTGHVLMVGHLLQYHPAIQKLKSLDSRRSARQGSIHLLVPTEFREIANGGKHSLEFRATRYFRNSLLVGRGAYFYRGTRRQLSERQRVADVTLTSCNFASGVTAHNLRQLAASLQRAETRRRRRSPNGGL